MAYLGNLEGTGFSKIDKQSFNGNNSNTQFTLRHKVSQPEHIEVFVENVRQDPHSAYTVSGNQQVLETFMLFILVEQSIQLKYHQDKI